MCMRVGGWIRQGDPSLSTPGLYKDTRSIVQYSEVGIATLKCSAAILREQNYIFLSTNFTVLAYAKTKVNFFAWQNHKKS